MIHTEISLGSIQRTGAEDVFVLDARQLRHS
jgi:hypothetical protein